MNDRLRWRFWIETGMGVVSAVLALFTIVRKDWIEIVFNVDPDQHNGSLEWLIVGAAVAIALTSASLARREWRRRLAVSA